MLVPCFTHHSVSYLHFIFVLGDMTADKQLSSGLYCIATMFNQWEAMAPNPTAVLHPALAAINQRIYFGGYKRRIIAYDIKANRFVKCVNMKERRMHHSATVINTKLYMTGGRYLNNQEIVKDNDGCECYDPRTDK